MAVRLAALAGQAAGEVDHQEVDAWWSERIAPARRDAPAALGRIRLGGVSEPSDRDLVRAARRGDNDAASTLFRRHWTTAWRAAFAITGRRALADDVAADAFERAFAALDRFDERRPFQPWLHRIVANRALDLLRAERRLSDDEPSEPVDLQPDHYTGDRELLAAVAELALERRVVVILRFGVGMTPKEIAAALELPVGTVNSRLARSLEQLRNSFEVHGDERD